MLVSEKYLHTGFELFGRKAICDVVVMKNFIQFKILADRSSELRCGVFSEKLKVGSGCELHVETFVKLEVGKGASRGTRVVFHKTLYEKIAEFSPTSN